MKRSKNLTSRKSRYQRSLEIYLMNVVTDNHASRRELMQIHNEQRVYSLDNRISSLFGTSFFLSSG